MKEKSFVGLRVSVVLVLVILLFAVISFVVYQQSTRQTTVTQTTTFREIATTFSSLTVFRTVTESIPSIKTLTVGGVETRTVTSTLSLFSTITVTRDEEPRIVSICFSRPMNCAPILISLIDSANSSVFVAVYTFTRGDLADALIRARLRGVDVRVIIEEENVAARGSEFERLRDSGVDVRIDGNSRLMHHKFMVIDGVIVVTGSYNFSAAAEDGNDENIVVIWDRSVASQYQAEFYRVWQESAA